jgi:hypothetical protein
MSAIAAPGAVGDRVVLGGAEVGAVDQQALLAALHFEHELADRRVGDRFEGVPDPAALDRVRVE